MAQESRVPLADEYAYIAERVKELAKEQTVERPRWAIKYDRFWLHIAETGIAKEATGRLPVTHFDNEDDANAAIVRLNVSPPTRAYMRVERL